MSIHYRSDRDGSDIADDDHARLIIKIVISASYLDEPIVLARHWDMTQADFDSLASDANAMKNTIRDAAIIFMDKVENPE